MKLSEFKEGDLVIRKGETCERFVGEFLGEVYIGRNKNKARIKFSDGSVGFIPMNVLIHVEHQKENDK